MANQIISLSNITVRTSVTTSPGVAIPVGFTSAFLQINLTSAQKTDATLTLKVTLQLSSDGGVTWIDDAGISYQGPTPTNIPAGFGVPPYGIFDIPQWSGQVRAQYSASKSISGVGLTLTLS